MARRKNETINGTKPLEITFEKSDSNFNSNSKIPLPEEQCKAFAYPQLNL